WQTRAFGSPVGRGPPLRFARGSGVTDAGGPERTPRTLRHARRAVSSPPRRALRRGSRRPRVSCARRPASRRSLRRATAGRAALRTNRRNGGCRGAYHTARRSVTRTRNTFTTGQVYDTVITKERHGDYLALRVRSDSMTREDRPVAEDPGVSDQSDAGSTRSRRTEPSSAVSAPPHPSSARGIDHPRPGAQLGSNMKMSLAGRHEGEKLVQLA